MLWLDLVNLDLVATLEVNLSSLFCDTIPVPSYLLMFFFQEEAERKNIMQFESGLKIQIDSIPVRLLILHFSSIRIQNRAFVIKMKKRTGTGYR
jgi:hypothetical protein